MPPESTTVAKPDTAALVLPYRTMDSLPVEAIKAIVAKVHEVAAAVMKDGHHYGLIPGAGKQKVLLKPGAQLLCVTFQLRPMFVTLHRILDPDHVHYEVRCDLVSRATDECVATGSGAASSLEVKHRYRGAGKKCPDCDNQLRRSKFPSKETGKKGWYCWADKGGCGEEFEADDPAVAAQEVGKILNEDPHDLCNTLLKMANKRAMVDAVLNATAASDVFTQDLEDRVPFSKQGQRQANQEQAWQQFGGNWDGEKPKHASDDQCRQIENLRTELEKAGVPVADFDEKALAYNGVKTVRDLTTAQASALIGAMKMEFLRLNEIADRIVKAEAAEEKAKDPDPCPDDEGAHDDDVPF